MKPAIISELIFADDDVLLAKTGGFTTSYKFLE
jgi:hypothetical protein